MSYYLHLRYSKNNDEIDDFVRTKVEDKFRCMIGSGPYNTRDWEFKSSKAKLEKLMAQLKSFKPKVCKIRTWSSWEPKEWRIWA